MYNVEVAKDRNDHPAAAVKQKGESWAAFDDGCHSGFNAIKRFGVIS